jgi:hypothetical protein
MVRDQGCGLAATETVEPARPGLLANTEALDQLCVPLRVLALEIVEQATALANELQKTATGVVIFGVDLEVLGQVTDTLAEKRDLNFR